MSFSLELQNVFEKLRRKQSQNNSSRVQHLISKLRFGSFHYEGTPDGNSNNLFQVTLGIEFPVTPKRDENGFVFLYSYDCDHPIVSNNYINVRNLQDWLEKKLDKVLEDSSIYVTKYNAKSYTLEDDGWSEEIMKLNLVPAFEFDWDMWPLDWSQNTPSYKVVETRSHQWYAVPFIKWDSTNESNFIVCSPSWEKDSVLRFNNLDKFNAVLLLMKALRDINMSGLPLTNYMLKTVLLHQLPKFNWKQDLGTLLIGIWICLVDHLESNTLKLYLTDKINIFDCMNPQDLKKCSDIARGILLDLRNVKSKGPPYNLNNMFQVN